MVKLAIPQSLIGSLIDIAQLPDITYYPPNHRCAHWAVYDEQQNELLCPCAPTDSAAFEKIFSAASDILYKNFRHRLENADDILSFAPQEEHEETEAKPSDALDSNFRDSSPKPSAPAHEVPHPPATPGNIVLPQAAAGQRVQDDAPSPLAHEQDSHPAAATESDAAAHPEASPQPQAPVSETAHTPSPAMFRKKSTLSYTPPRIEEYLRQLRTNQAAQEHERSQGESRGENSSASPQTTPANVPGASAASGHQTTPAAARPAAAQPSVGTSATPLEEPVTKAERTANYRIDPGRLATFKKDNIDLVTIHEVITLGRAERLNEWTIRFRHNDYRVDVNAASMTVINAIDEFDEFDERNGTEYSPEAARQVLGVPDVTNCEFASGVQHYLKNHGGEAFDAMVEALSSPTKVRVNLDWTREYYGSTVMVTLSPDHRIVLGIKPIPGNTAGAQRRDLSENSAESASER